MLKQLKMKLLISFVAVLLAIAVLASVTYAWFSVSTTPEISAVSFNISIYHTLQVSLSAAGPWTDNITLEASFTDADLVKSLQPVSTLDGINWFSCTYNGSTLNELALFDHSDTLAWGNVRYTASFTDASGTDITDETEKRNAAESQSHFVYTDFWLRTEDPDGCKVRLSVPSVSTTDAELNGHYGTYVLPKYVASGTEIICESNGAETAVRVGFLIYGDGPDASPTDFYIYEPNADKRSSADQKETAGEYVKGYSYSSSYSDSNYIKTRPIGWLPDLVSYPMPTLYVESGGAMVSYSGTLSTDTNYYVHGTDYVSGTDTPTYCKTDPAYVLFEPPELYASNKASLGNKPVTPTDTTVTYYYSTGYSAQLADIEPDHLIVQKAGEWDLDKVKEKLSNKESLNSTAVASFGSFINTDDIYASENTAVALSDLSTDIAGNAILLTLKADTPVKIRLIVWVEGQDPDCWNDIHTGSFTINVELAGESHD